MDPASFGVSRESRNEHVYYYTYDQIRFLALLISLFFSFSNFVRDFFLNV